MAAAAVEVEAFERRAPPAPTTPPNVGQAATESEADFIWEQRKYILLLATLAATVTYSAGGLNPPGGFWTFWSGDYGALLNRDLLSFCCSSTAFAASMAVMLLLLMRKAFRTEGVKYWALQVAMTLCLFALIGAYAVGTWQNVNTFIYDVGLVAAVLLYIGIQVRLVLLCKRKRRGNLQIHRQQSRVSEQGNDDARRDLEQPWRKHLLLLAILASAITYQAGMDPPGGLWEGRADDAGDHGTYPKRYLVFCLCNAIAFVTSLVVILVLLLNNLFRDEGMKHRALQSALALDLFGLAGAYAAGSCRQFPSFVNLSVLLVPVSLYAVMHVVVFMSKAFPSYATWRKALREKIGQCVPGWLKKLFEDADEEDVEEAAAAMNRTLEKRRRDLLLLLAILATALTYHAGMRDLCEDDLVHYAAFFYGNAAAFVASLAVTTTLLLPNRKLSARGRTRCYALWAFVILDVIGLTAAFAAGAYRRKPSVIDVVVLVSAILVCVAFQVIFSISETARGLVQWLGWPRLPLGADDEEVEGSEDDELELGLTGGTDGEPYGVEISSPILGGAFTLVLTVPLMAIFDNPVKLLLAPMVVWIGLSIWRRSLARPLRALARALQRRRVTPPAGSNASLRERLMPALCRSLGGLIHKLCPGTWLWSVFVVIWLPSLRPNLKLKFKISSISAVLAVLVVSTPTPATATTTATATDTGTSTTTATVDARSTATSSVTDDDARAATTTPGVRMARRVEPLVETRPRRSRRPNTRLIGQDWVN